MNSVNFPRALASFGVAAVVVVGLSACVDASPQSSSGPSNSSTSTASSSPTPTASPTSSATESPTTNPSPGVPEQAGLTVQILSAAYDASTSSVSVSGAVTNLVSATGTCSVQLSQGDESYSAEAAGVADAAVTYCSGFDVVLPDGSAGDWTVTLTFTDGDLTGSATSNLPIG